MFAVLEYFCTLRSATFARLVLRKKSFVIELLFSTFLRCCFRILNCFFPHTFDKSQDKTLVWVFNSFWKRLAPSLILLNYCFKKLYLTLCLSFLRITALLLPLSVLEYFCTLRSSSVARLVLRKKSFAILQSHPCVLRRCRSHMRCSSTFVHSAPLCSRALFYAKNPSQSCNPTFVESLSYQIRWFSCTFVFFAVISDRCLRPYFCTI